MGRTAEAELFGELLRALDEESEGATLEIAGEPGIGKTRLLRELAAAADARGHLVLSGRAAEFEAELPFGVFADAMDDRFRGMPARLLAELAGDAAADLAIVFPAFERLAQERPPELQQERYRAHRAVRYLLSTMAAERPVVVVLDDVQWADPGSVELLSHLLVHPPRGPVLLAVGARPTQIAPRLETAITAAERDQGAHRVRLGPLAVEEARELVGGNMPERAIERLYRESGGNPFFLLQLVRSATLAREAMVTSAHAASVPEPVQSALANELLKLSEPALLLLRGAAVAGDPFEARLAATAAGIGPAEALDLVDELLRFQLVHPTAVAGHFAFRHPIVRAAVYDLTATGWRGRAHGRLAATLAAQGANSSAQAPHLERSAEPGDMGAISVLVDAGRSTAPRAPGLAARWYGAALRLLPDGESTAGQRVELMIALATALGGAGRLDESRNVLIELLERLPGPHPARVPVVAYCAGVEHLLGRHRAADARLRAALAEIADRSSVDAVRLMVELAAGGGYENRYDDMLRWAESALEGATRLGDRALAVAAAGQVALARYFVGLPAAEAMDVAAAAVDALDDAELARRLDIGLWIGWTEAVLERHDEAIEHCRRVIDVSRAFGRGDFLLVTKTAQAWSLIRLGRLAEADELLAEAIEAGYLAPNLYLSVAVGLSCVVATCQGRFDVALRAGEESVRLARSADPGLIPGMSGFFNAVALIETGRARRARDVLLAMSGGGPHLRTSRSGYVAACELLARVELELHDVDAAAEWSRRAEEGTRGDDLVAEAASARRAMATVALAKGEPEHAARLAVDAALRAEDTRVPIEAGRCRIVAGSALVAMGQPARAEAELRRAAEDLRAIGAYAYSAQAEKQLRRLGRRVTGGSARATMVDEAMSLLEPGHAGLASLTRSERAVVALVADGLTNPEVAEKLYLSRHTVKRHLANAMGKLHVTSRRELRELARRASADPG